VIADPKGRLLWASPALAGAVHDVRAAREHGVSDALARAGINCWADKGCQGAGGTVRKALVDQGFKSQGVVHGTRLGIDVEIVERNPQDKGFVPQPKRWRVEQTHGILILHRRLVRDYEHYPSSSISRVYWAMTHVMARRLTGENTSTWRDPQTVTA
ncbi:hypothetical protein ACGFSD_31355, partial [Streptomyces caniferus]